MEKPSSCSGGGNAAGGMSGAGVSAKMPLGGALCGGQAGAASGASSAAAAGAEAGLCGASSAVGTEGVEGAGGAGAKEAGCPALRGPGWDAPPGVDRSL